MSVRTTIHSRLIRTFASSVCERTRIEWVVNFTRVHLFVLHPLLILRSKGITLILNGTRDKDTRFFRCFAADGGVQTCPPKDVQQRAAKSPFLGSGGGSGKRVNKISLSTYDRSRYFAFSNIRDYVSSIHRKIRGIPSLVLLLHQRLYLSWNHPPCSDFREIF